eukprot:6307113-Alexandrium_andersonii.AAC.1
MGPEAHSLAGIHDVQQATVESTSSIVDQPCLLQGNAATDDALAKWRSAAKAQLTVTTFASRYRLDAVT